MAAAPRALTFGSRPARLPPILSMMGCARARVVLAAALYSLRDICDTRYNSRYLTLAARAMRERPRPMRMMRPARGHRETPPWRPSIRLTTRPSNPSSRRRACTTTRRARFEPPRDQPDRRRPHSHCRAVHQRHGREWQDLPQPAARHRQVLSADPVHHPERHGGPGLPRHLHALGHPDRRAGDGQRCRQGHHREDLPEVLTASPDDGRGGPGGGPGRFALFGAVQGGVVAGATLR